MNDYECDLKLVDEFRKFTACVARQHVYMIGKSNEYVDDLEDHLARMLVVVKLYRTDQIRESFTRAFRLLLLKPLPSKLSLRALRGSLITMLDNVKVIAYLPNDIISRYSMIRNMELSLKVMNRLAKQYILMPEHLHRKYANHRYYFLNKFLPSALHKIVDLLYLDLRLAPLRVMLRVMPEIITFLTIVESNNELRGHFVSIGYKMIKLGLVPLGVKYRDHCIEECKSHSGGTEHRVLTRLLTFTATKRLIYNIWNHLENHEKERVLWDYEVEQQRSQIDTSRRRKTKLKVDLQSSLDCLSLIIRSNQSFIDRFRWKLKSHIHGFDFYISKMSDEFSKKKFRLNTCRVMGSLSIPLYGDATPTKFYEYTFGYQHKRFNSIYTLRNDGYNDRWIETSLCLLNILKESPRRSDGTERKYLVPDSHFERFASIQGMTVLRKLVRYCPHQISGFLLVIMDLTYSEFKKTESTQDTHDDQFWYRYETVKTMYVALESAFKEMLPPKMIDLSKSRQMICDILRGSTSNILRDEALNMIVLIKINVDDKWGVYIYNRPIYEISEETVKRRLDEMEALNHLYSLT